MKSNNDNPPFCWCDWIDVYLHMSFILDVTPCMLVASLPGLKGQGSSLVFRALRIKTRQA